MFKDAGNQLVSLMDEDPKVFDSILSIAPKWITRDVLFTVEAIGRGKIEPEALMLPAHIFKRLSMLSPEQQLKLIEGSQVPVVTGLNDSGNPDIKNVPLAKLSFTQATRSIGNGGIRTPEQQVALMKEKQSLGFWKFTVMNGKVFMTKVNPSDTAKVVLLFNGQAVVELRNS